MQFSYLPTIQGNVRNYKFYCFTQIGYDYKLSGRETLKVYVMFPTQERQLVDQRFSSLEKNNYRGQCTFIFSPALNPIKAELLRGFQKSPVEKSVLKASGKVLLAHFHGKTGRFCQIGKEELSFPESQEHVPLCNLPTTNIQIQYWQNVTDTCYVPGTVLYIL